VKCGNVLSSWYAGSSSVNVLVEEVSLCGPAVPFTKSRVNIKFQTSNNVTTHMP